MAKVKTVVQYEAEDGSVFLTEAEADGHDFKLKNKAVIDKVALAYVNSLQLVDRRRAAGLNQVETFLSFYLPWLDAGQPEVEQVAFDTPKPVAVEGVEGTVAETATSEAEANAGEDMFAAD